MRWEETMALTRREAMAGCGAALLTGLPAFAQAAYPSQIIKMIVPYPAGGTTDLLGRLVADQLRSGLGAHVSVEALVGAIVGGMGTLWGPLLGALVLHALADATRNLFGQLPGLNME